MKKITILLLLVATASCNLKYKHKNNDVQDYHWLGLTGKEEIRNDTIFSYNGKLGSDDYTVRIIRSVSDSSFSYMYFDEEKEDWTQAIATFESTMKEEIPYLIVNFHNSVSMFTRRRTCPINFEKVFSRNE